MGDDDDEAPTVEVRRRAPSPDDVRTEVPVHRGVSPAPGAPSTPAPASSWPGVVMAGVGAALGVAILLW